MGELLKPKLSSVLRTTTTSSSSALIRRPLKNPKMVCLACLLPLFLVPIVNLLPVIFDLIMAKVYRLFGWEYRKPERVPPACPIKPSAPKSGINASVTGNENLSASDPSPKPVGVGVGVDDGKQD